jgi:ubiquinone/menaquinone biosynthesis C-methylase UbiE
MPTMRERRTREEQTTSAPISQSPTTVPPMSGPAGTVTPFDTWARSYERSALQTILFIPAHQAALRLAWQHMPRPRRILDIGFGTARLLRQARHHYPNADLVGIDPAWQMLRIAAATPTAPPAPAIRYVRAAAEHLPFAHHSFNLIFATMSLRHWTNPTAAIAEIGRVLSPGGVLVLAEAFPTCPHQSSAVPRWWRRCRGEVPPELAAALAGQHLAIISDPHSLCHRLAGIQLLVARQAQHTAASEPQPDRLHTST